MGFSKMLELLQEKNKGYIILIAYNRIRKRRYNMDRRKNRRKTNSYKRASKKQIKITQKT